MKSSSLWTTIRQELFSIPSFFAIWSMALAYVLLSVVFLNYKFLFATFTSSFQLSAKVSIFLSLAEGLWTSMSHGDFVLLLMNACFFGINMLLLGKTISLLEHQGKVRLSIGGATLISLVTTGCASCGLSLLSVLGVTTSLSLLPAYNMAFHIGATAMLVLSTAYMLKKLHESTYCRI